MAKIVPTDDTIAAVGTSCGEAAIGIVRLSGPRAIALVDEAFLARNGKPLETLKSFSSRLGRIVRDKKAAGLRVDAVDEVIVSVMRGPKSYTREDVVEISSHGGAASLASILDLLLERGARLAQPGEFTKRAFLNGRIDLVQAEAVLDVVQAKTDLALRNSLAQLSGQLSGRLADLRQRLLVLLADGEAQIDFSDSGIEEEELSSWSCRLDEARRDLERLRQDGLRGRIIREGLKVVIHGRPNVGKSSLLNAILRQERAIVTPHAGTTRDTIEEWVNIRGLAVRLVDTAGLRESENEIEKEAIGRARKAIEEADAVLLVLDASVPLTREDEELAAALRGKTVIPVANKSDLSAKLDLGLAQKACGRPLVSVCALKGENIAALEEEILRCVLGGRGSFACEEGVVVSNRRHLEALKRGAEALEMSADSLRQGLSPEFVLLDLRRCLDALGELTGEVFNEEVLDTIFSKFCVGK